MRGVRLLGLVVVVAGTWAFVPGSVEAASIPTPSCNGGGCGGWFRSNVTVSWSYDPAGVASAPGCGSTTITEDTAGTTVTCTLNYSGGGGTFNSVSVQKDSSPPSVTASFARGPDVDGWYTSPVAVSFSGDGGPSGIASCTSGTYGGPDGADVKVTGSCTDGAGNVGSTTSSIRYDASPPTVKAVADRPPDADGWYNHPVKVAFEGEDAGAGVKECTAPVTYSGPDADAVHLVGQCRDAVGHLSAPVALDLRYDATKPPQPKVKATRASQAVTLSWTATAADIVRAEVVRAPGPKGKKSAVVFSGKGKRLVDKGVRASARYWYQVKLYDRAGNVSSRTLAVRPATGILVPASGAVLRRAPLVRWAPVKKARFYNLQLWRGNHKLLTAWPSQPRLRLEDTWRFGGKRQRLTNGAYRVYVWPAFGTLAKPRYGALVGRASFVVKRR